MVRELRPDRIPEPTPAVAGLALIAISAALFLAMLGERRRAWRVEEMIAAASVLVSAVLVWRFNDRDWVRYPVATSAVLAEISRARLRARLPRRKIDMNRGLRRLFRRRNIFD